MSAVAAGLLVMRAAQGVDASGAKLLLGGLAVGIVYMTLLRVLARGILRDAVSILPVPDHVSRRISRVLRLEVDGA